MKSPEEAAKIHPYLFSQSYVFGTILGKTVSIRR